jgi:5-methylcytosine-specific restriction endonuclease McrA
MARSTIFYDIPALWHENRKKGLCPVCGTDRSHFDKLQRVYCSTKCRDEYSARIITWGDLREKAINQYGKKCAKCGVNPESLDQRRKERQLLRINEWAQTHKAEIELERAELLRRAEDYYRKAMDDDYVIAQACPYDVKSIEFRDGFEVDHKIAIMNGGDQWDINNLQVLCEDCHKNKTRRDLKKSTELVIESSAPAVSEEVSNA